jgi:peptidoglycan/xylan/chitin deacetylase (PgdA/CDA1 family)
MGRLLVNIHTAIRANAKFTVVQCATACRLHERSIARLSAATGKGPTHVQIVTLHETPYSSADALRHQLQWVLERFTPIDLATFAQMAKGRSATETGGRPRILFTLDDGLLNNYQVAAPLLEEFGMRGVFFIVPKFALEADDTNGRCTADMTKYMSVEQVSDLSSRGHSIGNHTFSHPRLRKVPFADLRREIIEGAQCIKDWTATRVSAFAWTYAWDEISRESWQMAVKYHDLCFSPCPGVFRLGRDSPHLIWRNTVHATSRPREYQFDYSPLSTIPWSKRRHTLSSLLLG